MNGVLLEKWMLENGVRPEELAVKLSVSYGTVKNMLAGKKPRPMTIKSLARLTGLPEDSFLKEPFRSAS